MNLIAKKISNKLIYANIFVLVVVLVLVSFAVARYFSL